MTAFIDMTTWEGDTGHWIFIKPVEKTRAHGRHAMWEALCNAPGCGKIREVMGLSVRQGKSKSCCGQSHNRLPEGAAAANSTWRNMRAGARKRGHSWELTREQWDILVALACTYCGAQPSNVCVATLRGNGDFIYGGIDRVDNSLGYTLENCVPSCRQCNVAKMKGSVEEFYAWVERVLAHRQEAA